MIRAYSNGGGNVILLLAAHAGLHRGSGSGAAGTAVLTNGFASSVTITNGGSGYTAPFVVTFTGGGGFHATGTAIISNGMVTGVDMSGIIITKANAAVNVTPYAVIYDGMAHSATGTATGVLGENLSSLLTITSTHTNAGTYTDSWSFAGNANYFASSGTFTDTIYKADQTINWLNPASIIYGTALSSTQLNATVTVPGPDPAGALTYTPGVGAIVGSWKITQNVTLSVTAAATANYNAATKPRFLSLWWT